MKKPRRVVLGEGYAAYLEYERGRYRSIELCRRHPEECLAELAKPLNSRLYGKRIRLVAEIIPAKRAR